MYRLTLSGTPVAAWRAAHAAAPTAWMRVYRWENKWGTLMKQGRWEDVWHAEIRRPLAHDAAKEQLFESLESIQCSAPPAAVDDMWEEEVMIDGNISCNALLSITGTMSEVQRAVSVLTRDLGITLAPAISDMLWKTDQCSQSQGQTQQVQQPLQRVQPIGQPLQPRLQIQEMTQGSQSQRTHPTQPRRPPHMIRESQRESTHAPHQRQFQSRNDGQGQGPHSRSTHASSPRMQQDSSRSRQYEGRPSTDRQMMHQTSRMQSHQSHRKYPQQSALREQALKEPRVAQALKEPRVAQALKEPQQQGLLPTPE